MSVEPKHQDATTLKRQGVNRLELASETADAAEFVAENGYVSDPLGADCTCRGFGCVVCLSPLPVGKTCADCAHWKRCEAFGFSKAEETSCDFIPTRFLALAASVKEG